MVVGGVGSFIEQLVGGAILVLLLELGGGEEVAVEMLVVGISETEDVPSDEERVDVFRPG